MPRMAKSSVHTGNEPALVAFGSAVRELRLSRNLSQEALADLAGLDRSYTGGIERGEHNVCVDQYSTNSPCLGHQDKHTDGPCKALG